MFEGFNIFGVIDYLAVLLIIFIGVPHGAFDASVGMTLGFYKNKKSKIIFIFSYIILALMVVFVWHAFPELSLIIFLFASIFHFGFGDVKWTGQFKYFISGYFNGGLVIFGISFMNFNEVNLIYQMLIGSKNTDFIWFVLRSGSYAWGLILPFHLYLNYKEFDKIYLTRILLLIAIIYFAKPLVSFTFYFCFIHSFNHIKRILPSLKMNLEKKVIRNLFLLFTFLSWMAGIIIFFFLIKLYTIDDAIVKLTFIGLAALTFPHMILIELIFRPKIKI